eukprot:6212647-Pleurochrysis_carterae.AAC.4
MRFAVAVLFMHASAVLSFGQILVPDDAATCPCDSGNSLGGCLSGSSAEANNCARCYVLRRNAYRTSQDDKNACQSRWESQIRWMCAQGEPAFTQYAEARMADELPGADDDDDFNWATGFSDSASCAEVLPQAQSSGRTCGNFLQANTQVGPIDEEGFSRPWCASLTPKTLGDKQCADFFLFKRNWQGSSAPFLPVDFALRCTDNPSYRENAANPINPCIGAPPGESWTKIAFYCPLAENLAATG